MRKGLFFSVPSVSVEKTLTPIIEELRRARTHIISYNTSQFAPPATNASAFKPYPASYNGYSAAALNRQTSYFALVEMLLDSAHSVREFLQAQVAAERPDFILHSHLAPWGKAVAASYGLPGVALYSTFVLDRRIMLPAFRRQRGEGSEFKGDLAQFLRCQRKYEALYAGLPGGCRPPEIWDAFVNCEGLNLICTYREFQERVEMLGPEYCFVGHPTKAKPRTDERRLIYMSLGTIFTDDVELLRLCLGVFQQLNTPCLISLGTRVQPGELGAIPQNVRVETFVDQEHVLGEVAVFLTTGGMASVHEGIAAEAPMIVIPRIAEQRITAQRSERIGIAACVDRSTLTPDGLRHAIEHVLEHGSDYRAAMRRLKATLPGDTLQLARRSIGAYLDAEGRTAVAAG